MEITNNSTDENDTFELRDEFVEHQNRLVIELINKMKSSGSFYFSQWQQEWQQQQKVNTKFHFETKEQLKNILFSPEKQAIHQLVEDHLFLDENMEDLPIPMALDIINEYYSNQDKGITLTKDDITLIGILASMLDENTPPSVSAIISLLLFLSYFAKLDD